jgi:hypothetical protein
VKRPKWLSLDEHLILGAAAQKERDRYLRLSCKLGKVYGKTSRESRAAEKVYKALDKFRCIMDDAVFCEHRNEDFHAKVSVYYGGSNQHLHYCDVPDCGAAIGTGRADGGPNDCPAGEDHDLGRCGTCKDDPTLWN